MEVDIIDKVRHQKYENGRQVVWDASSLSSLLRCPQYYKYSNLEGWRYSGTQIAPAWGSAVHCGVEHLDKAIFAGASIDAAIEAGIVGMLKEYGEMLHASEDTARNMETACRAVAFKGWHSEGDGMETAKLPNGEPALECRFECPLPGTTHRFSGRIDRVAWLNGDLFIVDLKTTKAALTSYYFDSYSLNTQVYAYLWATRRVLGLPVVGFIIDGLHTLVNNTKFARGVFKVSDEQLDDWMYDVITFIKQAENYHDADHFPKNLGACFQKFSCTYKSVCGSRKNLRTGILNDSWTQKLHPSLKED